MGEIKNRIADFLSVGKDEAVTAVIESDVFPEVVKNIADVAVTEGTASVVGGVLGALAPRVHGVYLGYKVMNDFNVDNDELNTSKEKLVRYIKKISNSESYKISSLGWKYLRGLGMTQF